MLMARAAWVGSCRLRLVLNGYSIDIVQWVSRQEVHVVGCAKCSNSRLSSLEIDIVGYCRRRQMEVIHYTSSHLMWPQLFVGYPLTLNISIPHVVSCVSDNMPRSFSESHDHGDIVSHSVLGLCRYNPKGSSINQQLPRMSATE